MYRNSNAQEISNFLNLPYEGKNIDIFGVSPFNQLKSNTVSFSNNKIIEKNENALLIVPTDSKIIIDGPTILRSTNPRYTFAKITQFIKSIQSKYIHKYAVVDLSAEIDINVGIGPYTVIEAGVRVLRGTEIAGHVTLKAGIEIGYDCILKSGTVVGEDGFGFGFDSDGRAIKINHSGGVLIGNNVEIGSNSIICSGTICPTKINDFVKIDDLVFIAHNCHVGYGSIIAAGAVLCGSVSIGKLCWIGPNSSIINGISIADNVTIGIGSIITKEIARSSKYMSLAALPLRDLVALKKRMGLN
jgi:UDP-3-O-[3-hydroxymyristoyl] glucosamine N-acyltransferase